MPYWSAILAGFASGIVPTGMAEVVALGLGSVDPPGRAAVLLSLFTVAHVAAKVPWYALGLLSDRVTARWPRAQSQVARARAVLAAHPAYGFSVLAMAAFASVPPFHLAAIAAGIARIRFAPFLAICVAGRALRFALLGAGAGVVRRLLGW